MGRRRFEGGDAPSRPGVAGKECQPSLGEAPPLAFGAQIEGAEMERHTSPSRKAIGFS